MQDVTSGRQEERMCPLLSDTHFNTHTDIQIAGLMSNHGSESEISTFPLLFLELFYCVGRFYSCNQIRNGVSDKTQSWRQVSGLNLDFRVMSDITAVVWGRCQTDLKTQWLNVSHIGKEVKKQTKGGGKKTVVCNLFWEQTKWSNTPHLVLEGEKRPEQAVCAPESNRGRNSALHSHFRVVGFQGYSVQNSSWNIEANRR